MSEEYEFHDSHRPALSPGSYTMSVSWNVFVDGDRKDGAVETTGFHIAGERFTLQPADVQSVYPPEGSRGVYGASLPWIVLTRDTLPWERSAKSGADLPWLALILLNEEQAAASQPRTVTLSEYRSKVPFDYEPGQAGSDVVQVIDVPAQLLHAILPSIRELPLLCHARVAKQGVESSNCGVVVTKQLPAHGRNTVHLVGLENRYPDLEDRYLGSNFASQPACALISLKSWSFICDAKDDNQQDDKPESLDKLFERLNVSWLQLPGEVPDNYPGLGFVPLQHRFRTGESAASWYAGPLAPGCRRHFDAGLVNVPAQSADELLWYDQDLGMLNVTYAAAWELGRLLAMQNRRVFSLLFSWRRQQIHCAHAAAAAAPGSPCCDIPQIQCACSDAPEPPDELIAWIDGLRKLQGIPYRYLIADERLLPPESIRFFSLDATYISALLDGGLSSVRAPTQCPDHCRAGEVALLNKKVPGPVTGFFWRSAAVAGWPDLEVKAFEDAACTKALEVYRRAQLSPSILLYLFLGVAATVTIGQKPGTVHLSAQGPEKDSTGPMRVTNPLQFQSSSALANSLLDQPQTLKLSLSW
jgi:hypothetical protein